MKQRLNLSLESNNSVLDLILALYNRLEPAEKSVVKKILISNDTPLPEIKVQNVLKNIRRRAQKNPAFVPSNKEIREISELVRFKIYEQEKTESRH